MAYLILYLGIMLAALIAARLGLTCAYLLAYAMLEPVKRILSPFIYPVAWLFRGRLRARDKERPRMWEKWWEPYLFRPTFTPLWLFLDDSLMFSQGKEYDDKEKRYPGWIWRSQSPFLKAWWWAGIRNSMVNWNNLVAHNVGFHVSSIPATRPATGGFYEVHIYSTGKRRPYWEFWLFGRWNQVGWLRGNAAINGASRFEIDIMKVKK